MKKYLKYILILCELEEVIGLKPWNAIANYQPVKSDSINVAI